jgi:hypothetical protein
MNHQGDFSQWLQTMRGEQQRSPAPISAASSWADTDSDSDSDATDSGRHYAIRDTNSSSSKPAKMLPALERTAPMMIPQQSRYRHVRRVSYFENECEQDESLSSRHSASFAHNSSTFEHSDDDESDDPALYQNLAYFRSHSARKAASDRGARSWSSSPSSPSSPLSSQSDEDIFDMEL